MLPGAGGPGNDSHRRVRTSVTGDYPLRFLQMAAASLAFGIIQHDDKICLCGSQQALFDLLPGCQQIAEADGGKIVCQRGSQQRRAGTERWNSRHNLDCQNIGSIGPRSGSRW